MQENKEERIMKQIKLRNRKKRMERKQEEVQKSDSIGTDNDALSKIKRLREEQ